MPISYAVGNSLSDVYEYFGKFARDSAFVANILFIVGLLYIMYTVISIIQNVFLRK